MSDSTRNSNSVTILQHLQSLDERISRIESILNLKPLAEGVIDQEISKEKAEERSNRLEFQIGQYWLAKVGIIVIAIGIVLLLTFPYQSLPPVVPSAIGYVLVVAIGVLSYYWRNTYTFVSRYLLGGALLLLYFTTLRLSFFSIQPAIVNRVVEVVLLAIVIAINVYISIRVRSIYMTALTLILGYITAIVGDQTYFLLIAVLFMSALTVYISLRYHWRHLIFVGIFFTYLTHLIWFINNPFLGNTIQFVLTPQFNVVFVLLYALIFAAANLLRSKDVAEDNLVLISTFLSCVGSYGLFLFITYMQSARTIGLYQLGASIFFLILSIVFWIREKSKYSTFFYSILGYMALSAAIIAQFKMPDAAIWLCVQSLLVISTAIWFRSKFIVVANFIIYLAVLISYLVSAHTVSAVSLSYGVVALFSARIMNWQRDRLELNTEMMRNAYLITALCIIPYSLYHILPGEHVALSWVVVAILYYVSGRTMQIKKYRWMALATLLFTVLYVFIIGVTKFEPTYRIISFIVLGLVLLIISLVYFRMSKKPSQSEKGENDNTATKK